MNWLDCPAIEQVPGKLSGVPILKHSRVRPEDLILNEEEGEQWLADAFGIAINEIREVLAFYHEHQAELEVRF